MFVYRNIIDNFKCNIKFRRRLFTNKMEINMKCNYNQNHSNGKDDDEKPLPDPDPKDDDIIFKRKDKK